MKTHEKLSLIRFYAKCEYLSTKTKKALIDNLMGKDITKENITIENNVGNECELSF